jgi:TonB-linked SusC/RagA family outer membrane protein
MIIKRGFKKGKRIGFVIMLLVGLLTASVASAQSSAIKGVVSDDTGLPMPGVNIIEKGTKNSASSDADGKFSIRVAGPKSELVFSYIGFDNSTVAVGKKTNLAVRLQSTTSKLNEVVVVGYGTVKKSDLTGSVATISGGDLRKVPTSSVAESLTGRIAGVQVTSAEGAPDATIKIRVRGGGSLTQDASPLVIVDGFPVNSMNDVSPSEVETITVLKDASSTAIYGSRGANGVIIITTKKGKNNKLSVSYNGYYGTKTLANKIQVLNPADFTKWQYEYALLKKGDANSYEKYFGKWSDHDLYEGVEGDNWQEQIYGNLGTVQSHDLGIRGGSDKINYNFNYAHYDEKAIMVGSNFKRDNLSLNLQNKASDKIDLGYIVRYSNTNIGGGGSDEQKSTTTADSRFKQTVGYSPIPMPGLTDGGGDDETAAYLVQPYRLNFSMLGSLGWKIIDNLQFKSEFGLDTYNNMTYQYYGKTTTYAKNTPPAEFHNLPSIVISNEMNKRFRNANTLNYDFKNYIKGDHSLKLLLGEEMINYKNNVVSNSVNGFPAGFSFEDTKNLAALGHPLVVSNYYSPDDKLLSFFGRANYDFKSKYLFTATLRADGSSKFLGDNVWGYFPSIAGAWKISDENFLKDVSWVNSLKLRLSFGTAGNNNIPTGQTSQVFTLPTGTSGIGWINGVDSFWAPSKIMANPDLKWETTTTQDIGIDYSFFKNRVSGTVDFYKNITSDLLSQFPISGVGYDYQYRNMGEIQNQGVEFAVNVAAIQQEDAGLSFSFNIGFNQNRINSLGTMSNYGQASGWASTSINNDYAVNVGQPVGLMYGYKNAGRYEVSDFDYTTSGGYVLKAGVPDDSKIVTKAQPGTMKLQDISGVDGTPDGKIDANDMTVIGNANPKATGGFVINGNFKNFDLMMAFNFSYGNKIYNANKIEETTTSGTPNGQYRNLNTVMADGKRWTNLDPATGTLVTDPTALAALNENTTMWSPLMDRYVFSDWAVEDGSFLRLGTFTFGYNTPDAIANRFGMNKLRFFTTMSNVFCITNYSGPDPEVSTRRQTALTPGVDYSAYPRSRQIIFGLNLSF